MNSELRQAAKKITKINQISFDGGHTWAWPPLPVDECIEICKAFLSEHPPDDDEAIDIAWLESVGFRAVPSDMGPNYNDHYQLGKMNLWEFNETGEWLLNFCDFISCKTRRDVRRLCEALGITLKETPCS